MKIDKNDYPKLPDDISDMIRQEVEKHVATETKKTGFDGKNKFIRYAVAVIAGCLLVGTTVYATSKLISITTEKKGEYGLETKVTVSEDTSGGEVTEKENTDTENTDDVTTEAAYDKYELMQEINYVYLNLSYLPEDMYWNWCDENVGVPKLLFWSETDRENRHFTFYMWRIHEGIEYTHDDVNVINTETFEVDGGTAVLVELDDGRRKVYMAYDIGYVLDIWAQPGITKDELINVAKGIGINVVTEEEADGMNPVMEAPAYLPPEEYANEESQDSIMVYEEPEQKTSVSKDEFDKIYQVGEAFQIPALKGQQFHDCEATAKVTKVEICDDLSIVDKDVFNCFQGEYPEYIDENGKLRDETISYCKSGDGVNTLDEAVVTETIPVKLVYIEVEYTSDTGAADMLFYGNLMLVKENEDGYELYDGLSSLAKATEYDKVDTTYYENEPKRLYYYNGNDVSENNHFMIMKAEETRTASYAYIVREDWLPYMYFDVACADYLGYFQERTLKTGLVYIGQ